MHEHKDFCYELKVLCMVTSDGNINRWLTNEFMILARMLMLRNVKKYEKPN